MNVIQDTIAQNIPTRKSTVEVVERISHLIMIFTTVVNLVNLVLLSVLAPFSHFFGTMPLQEQLKKKKVSFSSQFQVITIADN